mmetsp:Transcript_20717/g.62027  ORF Transcript_20717/g.62027 Transcript_20717/m.62027 type:complete len:222 (-) Transcript_20717:9-674(-)
MLGHLSSPACSNFKSFARCPLVFICAMGYSFMFRMSWFDGMPVSPWNSLFTSLTLPTATTSRAVVLPPEILPGIVPLTGCLFLTLVKVSRVRAMSVINCVVLAGSIVIAARWWSGRAPSLPRKCPTRCSETSLSSNVKLLLFVFFSKPFHARELLLDRRWSGGMPSLSLAWSFRSACPATSPAFTPSAPVLRSAVLWPSGCGRAPSTVRNLKRSIDRFGIP